MLSPLSHPVYVMAKPVGDACNLACSYCYYRGKSDAHHMSDELLETFIRQYIEMQTSPDVLFTWHGGEPMLAGLDFYRRAVRLQQQYADGHHIDNALQTNGTLLTPEWCRFLHDEGWLVGISIDGPQHLHDACRPTRHRKPTWEKVMHAIDLLKRFQVEWNAMATVNAVNAPHPVEFYNFFRSIGCSYLQFTPVVEEDADHHVDAHAWGRFLCEVFDQWVRHDVGRIFVQLFDATLAAWVGAVPGVCTMAPTCGDAAVIEADGSVYACDHFVDSGHRLGQLRASGADDQSPTLFQLLHSPQQQAFGRAKRDALPLQCRQCRWLFACHGECPRGRNLNDCNGQPGLNCLCEGYKQYFNHVTPAMNFMRDQLAAGLPPANVMQFFS